MLKRLKSFFTQKISFKFLVITSLTITGSFGCVFLWFSQQQEEQVMEQVRKQAIILHKQIVLTRQWVADNKSVLIPEGPDAHLGSLREQPTVVARDGTVYTEIGPAVMTKLLSARAVKSGLYSFKLTNTGPLDPDNAPDKFELEALKLFRSSQQKSVSRTEQRNGSTVFRYVAPVYVNESCTQCHTDKFRLGDVGGCLSVFIPMDEAKSAISHNRAILLGGGVAFAVSLVALLFLSARSLVFKRIYDIRSVMSKIRVSSSGENQPPQGDELKDIADFCYFFDKKMRTQHEELERKIAEATKDLSETNRDLEAANRELVRLNRAKSEFFSDISHELRTPLTSIKGAADIMMRKAPGENLEYLDIIRRNTDHLVKIVRDFLDFSKIESGQLELDLGNNSIKDVAKDAILSQKAMAVKKQLRFDLRASGDRTHTMFDRQRIYQVLTNLLSNAVRFSPEGGTITVNVASNGHGFVEVSVEDQGPGIEEKYHSAIFEKFYQVKQQDKTLHQGSSGIGLAICKGIVRAHGGRIWVESLPGKGSKFVLVLPATVEALSDGSPSARSTLR